MGYAVKLSSGSAPIKVSFTYGLRYKGSATLNTSIDVTKKYIFVNSIIYTGYGNNSYNGTNSWFIDKGQIISLIYKGGAWNNIAIANDLLYIYI